MSNSNFYTLENSLRRIVELIQKAGVHNLSRGVQLGAISWAVKMGDALQAAEITLGMEAANKARESHSKCARCSGSGTEANSQGPMDLCPDCLGSGRA